MIAWRGEQSPNIVNFLVESVSPTMQAQRPLQCGFLYCKTNSPTFGRSHIMQWWLLLQEQRTVFYFVPSPWWQMFPCLGHWWVQVAMAAVWGCRLNQQLDSRWFYQNTAPYQGHLQSDPDYPISRKAMIFSHSSWLWRTFILISQCIVFQVVNQNVRLRAKA